MSYKKVRDFSCIIEIQIFKKPGHKKKKKERRTDWLCYVRHTLEECLLMLMRHFKQRLTFLFTEGYSTPKYDGEWHGGTLILKLQTVFVFNLGKVSNSVL